LSTEITRKGTTIRVSTGMPARVIFMTIAETANPRAIAYRRKTEVNRKPQALRRRSMNPVMNVSGTINTKSISWITNGHNRFGRYIFLGVSPYLLRRTSLLSLRIIRFVCVSSIKNWRNSSRENRYGRKSLRRGSRKIYPELKRINNPLINFSLIKIVQFLITEQRPTRLVIQVADVT
jgi:hypothetical protein